MTPTKEYLDSIINKETLIKAMHKFVPDYSILTFMRNGEKVPHKVAYRVIKAGTKQYLGHGTMFESNEAYGVTLYIDPGKMFWVGLASNGPSDSVWIVPGTLE